MSESTNPKAEIRNPNLSFGLSHSDLRFRPLVLLADDEPDTVLVTKTRIQLNGYDVVTATDGEAALALIRETLPDLILLDLKMPRFDGFQVCKIVKADPALAKIPVLIFSASSTYALCLEKQCLQLGADGYIRKPFDVKDLLAKIAGLIARRQCGTGNSECGIPHSSLRIPH